MVKERKLRMRSCRNSTWLFPGYSAVASIVNVRRFVVQHPLSLCRNRVCQVRSVIAFRGACVRDNDETWITTFRSFAALLVHLTRRDRRPTIIVLY